MGGSTVVIGWGLGAALLILVGLAVAANAAGSLGLAGNVATAAVRAVVQLGMVSGIIVAVVRSLWLAGGFVLVMFTIAVLTSGRRMTPDATGCSLLCRSPGGPSRCWPSCSAPVPYRSRGSLWCR